MSLKLTTQELMGENGMFTVAQSARISFKYILFE